MFFIIPANAYRENLSMTCSRYNYSATNPVGTDNPGCFCVSTQESLPASAQGARTC